MNKARTRPEHIQMNKVVDKSTNRFYFCHFFTSVISTAVRNDNLLETLI